MALIVASLALRRQVKKVTYGLERNVERLPIASPVKQNYQQQLEQAEEQLTHTQEEILTESEKWSNAR